MIQRKVKKCKCGCGNEGFIWAKGMLKGCYLRAFPPKRIKPISDKKAVEIKQGKEYYRLAIGRNIIKNKGKCRCEECGEEIKKPTGRNVCHIISGQANKALYLEPENSFILGKGPLFKECDCGEQFDNGLKQKEMKIYPLRIERKERLNLKYYAKELNTKAVEGN